MILIAMWLHTFINVFMDIILSFYRYKKNIYLPKYYTERTTNMAVTTHPSDKIIPKWAMKTTWRQHWYLTYWCAFKQSPQGCPLNGLSHHDLISQADHLYNPVWNLLLRRSKQKSGHKTITLYCQCNEKGRTQSIIVRISDVRGGKQTSLPGMTSEKHAQWTQSNLDAIQRKLSTRRICRQNTGQSLLRLNQEVQSATWRNFKATASAGLERGSQRASRTKTRSRDRSLALTSNFKECGKKVTPPASHPQSQYVYERRPPAQ